MGLRRTNHNSAARPKFMKLFLAVLTVVAAAAGVLAAPTPAYATPGVPANLSLTLSPSSIRADNGTSTSTATATVTSSEGLPVAGTQVNFGTDGDVTFSPPSGQATTGADGK